MALHMTTWRRDNPGKTPVVLTGKAEELWRARTLGFIRLENFQRVDFVLEKELSDLDMWIEKGVVPVSEKRYGLFRLRQGSGEPSECVGKFSSWALARKARSQFKKVERCPENLYGIFSLNTTDEEE